MDPLPEEADELADPQQGEAAVPDEPHVRRLPPQARDLGARFAQLGRDTAALRVAHADGRRPNPRSAGPDQLAAAQRQRRSGRRVGARHRIDDGPEDPEGEEHVADADDVADDRDRQGNDVTEEAAAGHELGHAVHAQDEVERVAGDVRIGEAGGVEGPGPDRHHAAVDEDGQQVGADADRGHLEARHAPVAPQPGEDEDVGTDVEGTDGQARQRLDVAG